MARLYSTKGLFRQIPNAFLTGYLHGRILFDHLDFSAMKEPQPDDLFAAWLALSGSQRNEMDAEFWEIFEMSDEKGFQSIIDEAVEIEDRRFRYS